MNFKDKLKEAILAVSIASAPLNTMNAAENTAEDNTPDKYKTTISVKNDTIMMVNSQKAFYSPDDGQIVRNVGRMKMSDFNPNLKETAVPEELLFVHERQHEIDIEIKKIGTTNMSLNEDYQRNVHMEISALIAEKLEIRNQYKSAKTPEEKSAVLDKFSHTEGNSEYINAIRSGKINPDSSSSKDFAAEMAFIKENSTKFRADPNDDGYRAQWEMMSTAYLNRAGHQAKSNPAGLKKEVHAIYQIGGIDFTQYGNHKDIVLENQNMIAADNMLAQGADPQKLTAFMAEGEGPYQLAESLDVSGLSKEQAEKVLQTAIMTQFFAPNIAESLCFGEEPSFDYSYASRTLQEKTAIYLDLKSDIWEKNNTLSEEGNPEKFAQLMNQAKQIKLDTQSWYKNNKDIIRGNHEEIQQKVSELQGKVINFDETVTNKDEMKLPLDGTTKEDVLAQKARKAKEDADFLEEYYKKNPESAKRHMSEEMKIEITDYNSDILKDELAALKKAEEEKNKTPTPTSYTLADGGIHINIPDKDNPNAMAENSQFKDTYQNAEIKRFKDPNGGFLDITTIDGKPHGLTYIMDEKGNIKDYKLYDKGKELDLTNVKFETVTKTDDKGNTHTYTMVDGKKFGTETLTTPDGEIHAKIHNSIGGEILAGNNSQLNIVEPPIPLRPQEQETSYSFSDKAFNMTPNFNIFAPQSNSQETSRDTLKSELKSQTGELPVNPQTKAQEMRFDKHFNTRAEEKSKVNTQDITSKDKTISFDIPFWQQQSQSRE